MTVAEKPEDVLIVDDNPANLRLLSQILRDRGYRARSATSGSRALDSVQFCVPDLVLLDIRMPEMDGYEVCQRLKGNPQTRDVPVIFVSALDEIEDKMKAFAVGGVDYVTKPFQVEEVVARVETHLALRRLQRTLEDANRRMQAELALAAQVQQSFLPKDLPQLPGWQLAVSLIPAQTMSGDFFDVVVLPGGCLALLIADVVDKGVWAALFMAMSCALLRTHLSDAPQCPEEVCREVNHSILQYSTANQFVSVFLGILDTSSGRLTYCNAGHIPPVWLKRGLPRHAGRFTLTGPPLGVIEDGEWNQQSVELSPGDTLILCTDGITEAEDETGDPFGLDRLTDSALSAPPDSANAIRDTILTSVRQFNGHANLSDDIALMVLHRDGEPSQSSRGSSMEAPHGSVEANG